MNPTTQQAAFLTALTSTTSNLALVARAGCGKTSTILMGVSAVAKANPRAEILVCAFNKSIADEVGGKLKAAGHTDWRTVQASTLHSMGFGLLKYTFKPTIEDKKVLHLIDARNDDVYDEYRQQIAQLVRYAKQAAFGFFPQLSVGNKAAWYELADHYGVNGFEDTTDLDPVIEAAQAIYAESLRQTDIVDFDDMILFPLVKNLRVKFGKDVIFLDEAQDLSPARQALVKKFLKRDGRLIIVGDDRQAIYGFTGADAEALPNMIKAMNATILPLSITWRCPKAVVRVAQGLVPDIEAAPTAPEGSVIALTQLPDDICKTDAILCRNTAPLIPIAYSLLRAGKPCKVEGRAIGDGLKALAQRWKVSTISALLTRLDAYKDREVQKAMAKDDEAKAQEVEDRVMTLVEIAAACVAQNKHNVSDIIAFIDSLFADGAENVTVLATYHRSKGREWRRVFLWEHSTRCPSKAARQPWQQAQEANLAYVAITRAQDTLAFVN